MLGRVTTGLEWWSFRDDLMNLECGGSNRAGHAHFIIGVDTALGEGGGPGFYGVSSREAARSALWIPGWEGAQHMAGVWEQFRRGHPKAVSTFVPHSATAVQIVGVAEGFRHDRAGSCHRILSAALLEFCFQLLDPLF